MSALARPSTTGFTRPVYSQKLVVPSDHVAVDETVIQLVDERYWLYGAVDPDTNEVPHARLELTRTDVFAHAFFAERRENHDDDIPRTAPQFSWAHKTRGVLRTPWFSSLAQRLRKTPAAAMASISDTNATEIASVSEIYSRI